jgi:high-affinity K+ transport system ATPase subunit B
MIQLDSQATAMIEGDMELHAQVVAKETQIEAMKAFATSENPDLIRAQQELSAL